MYDLKEKFDLGNFVVIDIETDALIDPSTIHFIVCKEENGDEHVFRDPLNRPKELSDFIGLCDRKRTVIGHNFLAYDLPVLRRLVPALVIDTNRVFDTLVVSRLLNYGINGGHSIAAWGDRVGIAKVGKEIEDWSRPTELMLERCISDVRVNFEMVTKRFWKYIIDDRWIVPLRTEMWTSVFCQEMHDNGMGFDVNLARKVQQQLWDLLQPIEDSFHQTFPDRARPVREVTPRLTKDGVFNLNDFRWYPDSDLSVFNGGPFTIVEWAPFNPGSPKQVVDRLWEFGWQPTEKTKGHLKLLSKRRRSPEDKERLKAFERYGWKVSEKNLETLPDDAPKAAFDLARWIVLNSRVADITEWLGLYREDSSGEISIHGRFNSIGAWTQRLSHNNPNMANIPVAKRSPQDNEFQTLVNDINDKMRSMYRARKGTRLIGTDAAGIQMRIFAHLVNDKELIYALTSGSKEDKTDIHNLHRRKLREDICQSRDDAKTFIYAWLLGAGIGKVAEILKCSWDEAKTAVDNFIRSYPLLNEIKKEQIPADASRGYFTGLDGRYVVCDSEHLMLAGYLQNGEAVIMKGAACSWQAKLRSEKIPFKLVTWPHDEWQTEIPDDDDICRYVQQVQIQALREQAPRLNFNLPLEGDSSWGYTWKETH